MQTRPIARSERPLVLVVDDEPLIRWSLRSYLEPEGFRVEEAATAAAAARYLKRGVDLVVLDRRLPDGDGLELLGFFRRRRPGCPVILMSAFGGAEIEAEASDRGAYAVVDKPFVLKQMARLVQDALARGSDSA